MYRKVGLTLREKSYPSKFQAEYVSLDKML